MRTFRRRADTRSNVSTARPLRGGRDLQFRLRPHRARVRRYVSPICGYSRRERRRPRRLRAGARRTMTEYPGWQMSEESLRTLASEISAGRSLVPPGWPENSRVAVLLSFDVDTQTWELTNGERPSSSDLSQGEYGARVGLQRVVDRLTDYRVPASFFVPAVSERRTSGERSTIRTSSESSRRER